MSRQKGITLHSLRSLREKAGYSQLKVMARAAGITYENLSKVEKGKTCSAELAQRIAAFLGVTVDDLQHEDLTRLSAICTLDQRKMLCGFVVARTPEGNFCFEHDLRAKPIEVTRDQLAFAKDNPDLDRLPVYEAIGRTRIHCPKCSHRFFRKTEEPVVGDGAIQRIGEAICAHHAQEDGDDEGARVKSLRTIRLLTEALRASGLTVSVLPANT